jgi:glycosyltransferase involved in cell wall biosynthesis
VTTRVAILWTRWSGYMEACYRDLASRTSVELFACIERENKLAPFDPSRFTSKPRLLMYDNGRPDAVLLEQQLESFKPDLILICSWHIAAYRHVAKRFAGRAVRVLAMDNQWRGTATQFLGILAFRTIWRDLYDAALVSGPRQYAFARLLGFRDGRIHLGNYSCDVELFSRAERRDITKRWLYVGRNAPEKGLDILMEAYKRYRSSVADPWALRLVGLHEPIDAEPGVESAGFIQPEDLPGIFEQATALVLPSRFEPHGVIVQEAAAAGLVIVCSDEVGAGDVFVRQGLNGVVFTTSSASNLTEALVAVHGWDAAHLASASATSRSLAQQFTPKAWSSTILALACSKAKR